jgi:serine/threonine-protein kinase
MNDLVGQSIGPYQLTSKIGEGGMAVVYKGFQQSLNRYVAIKVLRSELAQDEQFVERFRREALAVADLSHPNILHVYDAGVFQGLYYIVMAYVDGGSLKDVIGQGPMDIDMAVSIAAQMADALGHAHKRGLVHRDVKPNNILITRDGRPLLTDFGIAKAVHESQGLTRTGTSIGTPEYMAPEQIQGQKVDGRTDIYALGVVLYEMLVGWAPFSATTPVAALYKQVNEPPPPLRQANINVPDWLESVTNKALAKRPQDRYKTGAEFAAALRQRQVPVQASTAPMPSQEPVPSPGPMRKPAEKRRRGGAAPILVAAIVLVFVALAAAAVILLLSGGGGTAQATPRVVQVTKVITPTPQEIGGYPAPVLLEPAAGAVLGNDARFGWQWNGPALGNNHAFGLYVWSQAEEEAGAVPQKAVEPTTATAVDVDLAALPSIVDHGPGNYWWMVLVIDTQTEGVLGEWGEQRWFEYQP